MTDLPAYRVVPIQDLIVYARNARTHSDAQVQQLAASIREFGFTNPILIDDAQNIIAGHGRVMAARLLGLTEVPAIVLVGLTAAQKCALVIADNKLALNAGWDGALLRLELQDLSGAMFDLSLTGFSEDELMGLLGAPEAPKVPEPKPAKTDFLKWAKQKIPLEPEEVEMLNERFAHYMDRTGMTIGFVKYLVG